MLLMVNVPEDVPARIANAMAFVLDLLKNKTPDL